MNKHLLNEINRVKTIMGVKPLLTEGIGTLGLDLLQWMTRTSVKVLDEVPGLVDNFGNPLKKVFYQFGDVKVPENVYEIFKKLCDGTESFNNLISKGRKDVVDMFLDVIEKSDILDNEIKGLINFARQSTPSLTEESILRAIKKEIDNGKSIDDVLSEMTGGDEFAMNVLKRKFSQKLDNLPDEVESFVGNTFDDIRSTIQRRWANALQNTSVDKSLKRKIVEWLGKKGLGQKLSSVMAQMIQKAPSRYDSVIDEMVTQWEEVFTKILKDKNYIRNINPDMFRSINIDIDALGMEISDDVRKFLLDEIRKVDFELPNGTRKLTENEISTIEQALNENKVFDNFIPKNKPVDNFILEKFYKSYYARFFTQKGRIGRFFAWAFTGTARTGKEWSIALRNKQGFSDYFGAYRDAVIAITVVCKGVLPLIMTVFYFASNTSKEMSKSGINKSREEVWGESIKQAFMNAWAPFDKNYQNILNFFIPVHVPATQFIKYVWDKSDNFLKGVYEDKINWDDVLEDIKGLEEYKNISEEEWRKISGFLKNSGRNLEDIVNLNMNQFNDDLKTVEKISETDTSTWEPGFMSWARLHFLTDAVFNTDTGMGKAKNPATGKFQLYEIQPDNKTFRERENK